mgnify:FL=1
MRRNLTFTFDFDPTDKTWSVTSPDAPGAIGIHETAYEALLECAFSAFDLAEDPDSAPRIHQEAYHRLNIDLFPYFPPEFEDDEEEERVLSPLQQERARRFMEGLDGAG